jgi:hypothetical protein
MAFYERCAPARDVLEDERRPQEVAVVERSS